MTTDERNHKMMVMLCEDKIFLKDIGAVYGMQPPSVLNNLRKHLTSLGLDGTMNRAQMELNYPEYIRVYEKMRQMPVDPHCCIECSKLKEKE